MADERLASLGELVDRLGSPTSLAARTSLREAVIDAMTTNETLWFRDGHPFRILDEILLPEFNARGGAQPLRIWSAASSTGQEAYSISMLVDEFRRRHPGALRGGVNIVGTDISARVLEVARLGEYEMLAIGRGLSQERLNTYFTPTGQGGWKIRPELTRGVEFRPLNLLDSYASLGKFDIVFCRNVLIYFSAELKRDIIGRLHATLRPGGYLILGASESLSGVQDKFDMVHCSPGIVYRAK